MADKFHNLEISSPQIVVREDGIEARDATINGIRGPRTVHLEIKVKLTSEGRKLMKQLGAKEARDREELPNRIFRGTKE